MAHKKAGGSSNNGRDSAGRRLGVKKSGGQAAFLGTLLFASAGRNIIRVPMLVWVKITRSSPSRKAASHSQRNETSEHLCLSSRWLKPQNSDPKQTDRPPKGGPRNSREIGPPVSLIFWDHSTSLPPKIGGAK